MRAAPVFGGFSLRLLSLGVGVDLTSSAYGGVMLLFLDLPFSECYLRGTLVNRTEYF